MIAFNYDPIVSGYVKSLSRPGGNITGVVSQQLELAQKQVELLTQAFPSKTHLAILFEAQSVDQFGAAERVAKSLKLEVQSLKLEGPSYDFDGAIRSAAAAGAQMLLRAFRLRDGRSTGRGLQKSRYSTACPPCSSPNITSKPAGLSARCRSLGDLSQGRGYVAKILKGAKQADLPVEQATKFELAVNLKTAKTIGVELPDSILLRADQLIE